MSPQDRYQQLRRELDADQFIQAARDKAGLSDFGDRHFEEPLRKLLDCAAREVDFHEQGLQVFKNDIVRWLVNRLRMQDDIKRHPEILQEDVSDPIVVIGLGRSGTTKLHKMLSAPDSVQKTYFWRMWNPARFPDAKAGRPDPRIAAAGTAGLISEDKPDLDAAHHMEEQEVEEEWVLFMGTFDNFVWNSVMLTPSYFDWVMQRRSLEVYRHVKTTMQYLQWQDGGRRGRPWVMKAVGYIADMDSLLACYPKATLVHAHRDPRDCVPSLAKLMCGMYPVYANLPNMHALGAEMLKEWSTAINRYLEARDRPGLDGRILDVKYEQIRSDPMSVIREVYRRAGRDLSAAAEQKMANWHAGNEQGKYGKHEYSLEEFGLSAAAIDKAFAKYIARFIER